MAVSGEPSSACLVVLSSSDPQCGRGPAYVSLSVQVCRLWAGGATCEDNNVESGRARVLGQWVPARGLGRTLRATDHPEPGLS